MKQIVQNLRSGETVVAEVPVPTPQKGQVLIRTMASLVSAGTERMLVDFASKSLAGKARSRPDLMKQVVDKARREGIMTTMEASFNRLDQPMPLGYSSAGVIEEIGPGVSEFKLGQRVACAGGGYAVHAEYAVVPKILSTPLPTQVSFESAAFTTLGAIALHGFRLTRVQIGSRVAVVGLGLLGLLSAQISQAAGCSVLGIDLDPQRVRFAREIGIKAVSRQQAVETAASDSRGQGYDAVLICADTSSNDPVQLAGEIARDRAVIAAVGAVGLEIPRKLYFEKELTFLNSRSYGPGRYDPSYEEGGRDYPIGYVRWSEGRNFEAFVEFLETGCVDVKPLITHRFPIETAAQAYALIAGKTDEPFLGVLITYPESQAQLRTPGMQKPTTLATHDVMGERKPVFMPDRVKLGVLGAGNFATSVMLPAIKNAGTADLVGIASASGLKAQHAAERYGFNYASSDEEQVINDPQTNTVAILTRHHLHARQVLKSLQAGKHVFCEKPLAINEDELVEIEGFFTSNLTEKSPKPPSDSPPSIPHPLLIVGFNRRFAPLTIKLKDFLTPRSEALFAHYRVNAGFIPADHWTQDPEIGGGRIIGECCHFIDFLTFLVGEQPNSVTAHALPDSGRYLQDNVMLTYNFPDGSLGTISYLANGDRSIPKERLEVFCGGKVAVLDDFRSLELASAGKRNQHRSRMRQDKGHKAEWSAFTKAVISGGPPPIPYNQLFGGARAAFAALESLRTHQRVEIN